MVLGEYGVPALLCLGWMFFPEGSGVQHGEIEVLRSGALAAIRPVDWAVVGSLGGFELAHSLRIGGCYACRS